MKICFIVGAFPKMKCGIGDYTYKLAQELSKKNYEITIITSTKADNNIEGMKVFNIVDDWTTISGNRKIVKKLKEIKPDIVNIQYPSYEYKDSIAFHLLPIMIKIRLKCKIVMTVHEYVCFTFLRSIRKFLNFMCVNKIIVVENEYINKISKVYRKKKNIIHIPVSSFVPPSDITDDIKNKIIKDNNLENVHIISYFGFAVIRKGIEYILYALKDLENTKLLFVGELDKQDEYHNKILKLIDELEINNKVCITGFLNDVNDVANYLSVSDVCVLPFTEGVQSRNTSFLAAYNQQIPIITTSFDLNDSNGIFYVKPNDQENLTKKIEFVLNNKPEFLRDPVTWENIVNSYIDVYKMR